MTTQVTFRKRRNCLVRSGGENPLLHVVPLTTSKPAVTTMTTLNCEPQQSLHLQTSEHSHRDVSTDSVMSNKSTKVSKAVMKFFKSHGRFRRTLRSQRTVLTIGSDNEDKNSMSSSSSSTQTTVHNAKSTPEQILVPISTFTKVSVENTLKNGETVEVSEELADPTVPIDNRSDDLCDFDPADFEDVWRDAVEDFNDLVALPDDEVYTGDELSSLSNHSDTSYYTAVASSPSFDNRSSFAGTNSAPERCYRCALRCFATAGSMKTSSPTTVNKTPAKTWKVSVFQNEEDDLVFALLEQALRAANEGLDLVSKGEIANVNDDTLTDSLYWKLLQLKAQVLGRMRRFQESLIEHESLLKLLDQAHRKSEKELPSLSLLSTQADLLYTSGRLCVYAKDYRRALFYYQRELQVTKLLLSRTQHVDVASLVDVENKVNPHNPLQHLAPSSCTLGVTSLLALSRIHHELAKLHKLACGDESAALKEYKMALAIETDVYQRLKNEASKCSKCQVTLYTTTKCNKKFKSISPDSECSHPTDLLETARQIRDTKKSIGRVIFEQGDFNRAVRVSL